MTSLVEVVKHWLLREVAEVISSQGSTVALYQGKWPQFLCWCHGQNVSPCKASIPQIAKFFLYLWRELKLSVPAVKCYHATLMFC